MQPSEIFESISIILTLVLRTESCAAPRTTVTIRSDCYSPSQSKPDLRTYPAATDNRIEITADFSYSERFLFEIFERKERDCEWFGTRQLFGIDGAEQFIEKSYSLENQNYTLYEVLIPVIKMYRFRRALDYILHWKYNVKSAKHLRSAEMVVSICKVARKSTV